MGSQLRTDAVRIATSPTPAFWPHADHRGTWLVVFRLRALFIVAVGGAAALGATLGWLHAGVSLALVFGVLPYNSLLQRATRGRGTPPAAMAYGDQLLCAAFVLMFPATLTAAMVAATFDLATAASVFPRRTTLRAGALGLIGFAVALWLGVPDIMRSGVVLSVPAYGLAVLTLGALITGISQRERDAHLRSAALVDGLDAVVWEIDAATGRMTYVNAAVEQLVGYDPATWLADPALRLRSVDPADRAEVFARIEAAFADGEDYQHVYRLHHATGRVLWVRELVATDADERGATVRLRGTAIDVTESREAQLALASRSRQQLALVQIGDLAIREPSPEVVFASVVAMVADVLDADVVHIMAYDQDRAEATLAAQHGWSDEAVGRVFACPSSSHIRFTAANPTPVVFSDLPHDDRFTPLPELLAEGAVSGMGVAIAGTTGAFGTIGAYTRYPRHFTPDDTLFLQSVANTLTGVVVRTSVEAQLLQAQKMEAVGQLAGGMAHDFNNLLTAVLGYAELLEPSLAGDEFGAPALRELRSAGQRAAALVDQLLTFSRGRMGASGPVDVNSVVQAAQSLLSRLLGDDIAVLADTRAVDRVMGNVHQFEQLIVNLAVNARDAMPIGGTFTIATRDVGLDADAAAAIGVPQGRYVRLRCSDTGVGMDERTLQRAFEPFFTTKEAGKGTGLGLATVYAIARNAGGQVSLDSAPGHGTTVTLWLPACECSEAAQTSTPEAPEPAIGSETVLLVEDQATVQELLRQILEQHGYQVLLAADGNEALAMLGGGQSVTLLVTDVVMPQLSGPDLVALVLADHPGMKVLYISGYAEKTDLPLAPAGTDFLHKPFGVSEFLGKVRDLLDRTPVGAG